MIGLFVLTLLSVEPSTCLRAPLQPGATWVEDFQTDGLEGELRQLRHKTIVAVRDGGITALQVAPAPLDACQGSSFLLETDDGFRVGRDGGDAPWECWFDSRLGAQLGVVFVGAEQRVDHPFDMKDRAFSLLTGWPRQYQTASSTRSPPAVVLRRKGYRQHPLGSLQVFAVTLHLEHADCGLSGSDSWEEDDEGEVLLLDGTTLVVEAHLRGRAIHTRTHSEDPGDGGNVTYADTRKAKTRLDFVCRCDETAAVP